MRGLFLLLFLYSSVALGQVTLVSPEEGRRALKNLPAAPPSKLPSAPANPTPAAPPRSNRATVLPDQFAGWNSSGGEIFGPYNAATLAGKDAPVLVEYGYTGAERKRYTRGNETLTLEAFRMKDSSGSYGLYTFYRGESWLTRDQGGAQLALQDHEALLRKSEVLVRATLEGGTRLNEADLRALGTELETRGGGLLPNLPLYLPAQGLIPGSSKYVVGPEALSRVAPEVPLRLVDFDLDAEVDLARYRSRGGPTLRLLLLSYPTAQIAAAQLKNLGQVPGLNTQIYSRRAGPLLVFVIGANDKSEADALLNGVSYSADVVWNQRVDKDDAAGFAKYLLNVFVLAGAWLVFAVVAGLLFGLVRIVVKARYPNQQVFDSAQESEVIRLNISN